MAAAGSGPPGMAYAGMAITFLRPQCRWAAMNLRAVSAAGVAAGAATTPSGSGPLPPCGSTSTERSNYTPSAMAATALPCL